MRIVNKKDLIYQDILGRLLNKTYSFGEKISVKEISAETGISRQPIMTALNNLQERGFVVITAQVGCQVIEPEAAEVEDFYRMFSATEGLIASLAAQRHTPEELAYLVEINEQIAAVTQTTAGISEKYRQLNTDFHRHLHQMARSPILSARQMSNFELSDFFVVQTCGFKEHLDAATQEHIRIIAALGSRDPQTAYQEAASHINSVSNDVIAAMNRR